MLFLLDFLFWRSILMRKFILKILFFLCIILVIFTINFFINSYFISNQKIDINASTIIIGESHVKSGINPELIPDSRNIAQPAESILLTFHKLKKVHQLAPEKIKTFILGIGHNTFSAFNDGKFKHKQFSYEFMRRAYPLMTVNELSDCQPDWKAYLKTIIKQMLLYPRKKHDTYLGGFVPNNKKMNERKIKSHVDRHYYDSDGKLFPVSHASVSYLDSVIYYCINNDLDLILIYIPQHKDYVEKIPENIKSQFQKVKSDLSDRNVTFFDFHERFLENDYFANADHLNSKGADIVTKWLVEEIGKREK